MRGVAAPPAAALLALMLAVPAVTATLASGSSADGSADTVPCSCRADNCSISPVAATNIDTLWLNAHHVCNATWPAHPHAHLYEGVLAPIVILGTGALTKQLLQASGLHVPYTVTLLLLGAAAGLSLHYLFLRPLEEAAAASDAFADACDPSWFWYGVLQRSVGMLADIDPHLLLHIFIPPLIFESAFKVEWHVFFQLKWATLLLAVPGVIISTFVLGAVINMLYGAQDGEGASADGTAWPSNAGILLGVILSATDPVAVVALLGELGVKEELSTGIEGESLLNDGTALVFFQASRGWPQMAADGRGLLFDCHSIAIRSPLDCHWSPCPPRRCSSDWCECRPRQRPQSIPSSSSSCTRSAIDGHASALAARALAARALAARALAVRALAGRHVVL